MGKPAKSTKVEMIQMLRAVAALLVIFVHCVNVYDGWYQGQTASDHPYSMFGDGGAWNEFGASGVDLFFVISGFIMALVISEQKTVAPALFLRRRFERVVPLFWITAAFYTLYCIYLQVPFTAAEVIANFTILPIFGDYSAPLLTVGWSLAFELIFYGIVALSLMFARRYQFMIITTSVVVAGIGGRWFDHPSVVANEIFFEFLLGLVVFKIWKRLASPHPWIARVLVALGIAMLMLSASFGFPFNADYKYIISGDSGMVRTLYWGVPWSMVMLGLLWLDADARPTSSSLVRRVMLYLGNASYSLYLSHYFVITGGIWAQVMGWGHPDFIIAPLFVAAIGLGALWFEKIEKPILRRMSQPMRDASQQNKLQTTGTHRLAEDVA